MGTPSNSRPLTLRCPKPDTLALEINIIPAKFEKLISPWCHMQADYAAANRISLVKINPEMGVIGTLEVRPALAEIMVSL